MTPDELQTQLSADYWRTVDQLREEVARLTAERDATCKWTEQIDPDYWDTQCEECFSVIEGTLAQNGILYCPFCGRRVIDPSVTTTEGP